MLLALPILLPCYAALLLGLFPIGIGGGLLIIGTVLLMVQHTAEGEALAGVPAQLILPVLCAALCLLIGLSCQDKLNTDMVETMQTQLHQRHYDSDTNSMPEGNLKNLPAWNKSDTPALEVTMEQPEKVYLRGQVYDTYTGTGWKATQPIPKKPPNMRTFSIGSMRRVSTARVKLHWRMAIRRRPHRCP